MKIKIFTVPIENGEQEQDELNGFLASHRITDVHQQIIQASFGVAWTFSVSYLDGAPYADFSKKGKIDYKDVLSADEFAIFSKMREARKEIAQKEAVPAYNVFLDSELAEMVKMLPLDTKKILTIKGIAQKRVEKYGDTFISHLEQSIQDLPKQEESEKSKKPDSTNNSMEQPSASLF